jgi:hypothetical protein
VKITQIVRGKADTIISVRPQLRVPINASFINSILFNAGPAQLSSNLVFKNNVNGLYITLDKNQTGPGGTFMLSLDSAKIQVYYKTDNGTGIDTASATLPNTLHAAEIKHTYSTAVKTELSNTQTSRNIFYLQGMAGLRAKVSFPYIKNIVKSLGSDVVINRAELVITPSPGTDIPFPPLRRLAIYKYDIAHRRTYMEDSSPTDPRSLGIASGGYYDATTKAYHFLLSAYIQNLVRGITTDNVAYIGAVDPADVSAVNIGVTPQADGRTIAVGSDKTSPYRIKLNIIYTKISK